MKRNTKFIILLLVLAYTALAVPKPAKAQQSNVSFQIFYDELSPYGEWVDYPTYGYVWIPNEGSDFAPYSTEGQWIYTDYGWTWLSNYDWGWAPFHYGRWDYDDYYGWLWVPDTDWGPSWVTWVTADDYYGWQPMQPGISVNLSLGRDYRNNYDHWNFVRYRDFERSDIQHYCVDRSEHHRIIQNSIVINQTYIDRSQNITYVTGPARDEVQRVTGNNVRQIKIQENHKPGQDLSKDRLLIYRPEVKHHNDKEQKPTPRSVSNLKDVKRPSERITTNKASAIHPTNAVINGRQENKVSPQHNDNNKVWPNQQPNVKPSGNKRLDRQQNNVAPQQENQQVQPTKQQQVKPSSNRRQDRQQNNVRPQKENQQVQPDQQQQIKANSDMRQVNPAKTVKPEKVKKTRQPKTPKSEIKK